MRCIVDDEIRDIVSWRMIRLAKLETPPGLSILTGIVLCAVGVGYLLTDRYTHLGLIFSTAMLLCGIAEIVGAVREWYAQTPLNRTAREREIRCESWAEDFAWDQNGAHEDQMSIFLQSAAERLVALQGIVVVCLIEFTIAHWYFALNPNQNQYWILQGVLFALNFLTLIGVRWLMKWWQNRRGLGRLRFHSFPFFVGANANLTFVRPKSLTQLNRIWATLRCIEHEASGIKQTYAAAIVTDPPRDDEIKESFELSFDIPDSRAFVTELSSSQVRFWELEVRSATPRAKYLATFLVPIYAETGELQGKAK